MTHRTIDNNNNYCVEHTYIGVGSDTVGKSKVYQLFLVRNNFLLMILKIVQNDLPMINPSTKPYKTKTSNKCALSMPVQRLRPVL